MFATYEVPAQTYRNMEAKVRRMVDPKKRSGKVTASEALRKKWFESSEARKKLVLEMVNCGGDKAWLSLASASLWYIYVMNDSPAHGPGQVHRTPEAHPHQFPDAHRADVPRMAHETFDEGNFEVAKVAGSHVYCRKHKRKDCMSGFCNA